MSGNTTMKADIRLFARTDYFKHGAGTLGKQFPGNPIIDLAVRPDANIYLGGRLTSKLPDKYKSPGAKFEIDAGAYVGSQFGIKTDLEVYKTVHTFGDKRNQISGVVNVGLNADLNSDLITSSITDSNYIPYRAKAHVDLGYGVNARSAVTDNEWSFLLGARVGVVRDGIKNNEGWSGQNSILVSPTIKVEYKAEINANSGQTIDVFADVDVTECRVGARINLVR